jgi:hypothetical protein
MVETIHQSLVTEPMDDKAQDLPLVSTCSDNHSTVKSRRVRFRDQVSPIEPETDPSTMPTPILLAIDMSPSPVMSEEECSACFYSVCNYICFVFVRSAPHLW